MSVGVDYIKETAARLNAWRAELAQLELEADRKQSECQRDCYSDIQKLQKARNRMTSSLKELEATVDEARRDRLVEELERARGNFEEALTQCHERLAGETDQGES